MSLLQFQCSMLYTEIQTSPTVPWFEILFVFYPRWAGNFNQNRLKLLLFCAYSSWVTWCILKLYSESENISGSVVGALNKIWNKLILIKWFESENANLSKIFVWKQNNMEICTLKYQVENISIHNCSLPSKYIFLVHLSCIRYVIHNNNKYKSD